ncbi:glutamate receptor ionotropic, NMDA 2B [Caerostris extrusa]|uniref:Glutamate receptor ionotropic, NMDA 2B n=1 Tax=Caerostris extrusa TaxID=172846 RepID=A0AAV4XWZ6_CAEEX|nr:glutamate receptor ionotropic, NMDA 2B [Caerostris extrusa]
MNTKKEDFFAPETESRSYLKKRIWDTELFHHNCYSCEGNSCLAVSWERADKALYGLIRLITLHRAQTSLLISYTNRTTSALRVSDSRILQLAPTVEHQAQVMLSILKRYSWHTFSVVTSQIGGHDDFIRAIRDLIQRGFSRDFKLDILNIVTLKSADKEGYISELEDIANSEARIFLLFSTRNEAQEIMKGAKELGITGKTVRVDCFTISSGNRN